MGDDCDQHQHRRRRHAGGFACIVVAEGAEIGEDVREAARAKGVNLLASPRPAFELCAALAGEADK